MASEIQESIPTEGSAGSPNPSASQGSGVQPTSGFDAKALQEIEHLIERKVQSVKDRRFDEQGKRLGEVESVLERVKGLIPDKEFKELKKDLEFEDLKRRVYGDPQDAPQSGKLQERVAVDAQKVIEEFGLDVNDAKVRLELLSKSYKTAEEAEVAAAKFIKAQSKQPTPSDADAGSNPRQPPTSKMTESVAEEKYVELGKLMRNPSQNKSAIEAIKRQLIEGGYPL